MVKEILYTKKVREFPNFGPEVFGYGMYLIHFE